MKGKVYPTNDLEMLFKGLNDSSVIVITDDNYEYRITRKRR